MDIFDPRLRWASFSEEFDEPYCILAYSKAFALLPEILWIGHAIPVCQDLIHKVDIADATSKSVQACIQQSNLPTAVEFLEQGLATIFQQTLQLSSQPKDIPSEYAEALLDLSLQLYQGNPVNPSTIVEKRNELLRKISGTLGFEDFLLQKPYSVLCHASHGGPVIILTSHPDQCSAIIILNPTTKSIHLALLNVTLELLKSQQNILKQLLGRCNVRNRGQSSASRLFGRPEKYSTEPVEKCFKDLLTWLWTDIVHPIYAVLNSESNRIIYVLAKTNVSMTARDFDRPALKTPNIPPKLAVVRVTHSDSRRSNYLRGVDEEVKGIITVVTAAIVHSLVGPNATVDAVKDHLQECSWVHLGCPGIQSPGDPMVKSHLKLYESNLDLETILRVPLPNAQFVFLAACQTAMGDAKIINESFHLGGGFITAGFRSVIGTMWSMNDSDGPVVAEIVYSHLFRDGREPQASDAAGALHLAVRELKKRNVPYERWVPFIHMGI
ncbi:CHAT domain-containing protein [Mycena polygramma]|nr:CHAT domain-containing protein [Mycena polygramma]